MVDTDDSRVSDETLIGRIAAGDPSSFDRLVRRHQAAVYRFARAAVSGGAERPGRPGRSSTRPSAPPGAPPTATATSPPPAPGCSPSPARRSAGGTPALPRPISPRCASWRGRRAGGAPGTNRLARTAGTWRPPSPRSPPRTGRSSLSAIASTSRWTRPPESPASPTPPSTRACTGLACGCSPAAAPPAAERALAEERVAAGLHCGEVLADLTEHLDGRLSRDRAQRLDEHLEDCVGCRRFESAVTAVVRALRQLPDEALPSEVEESLLDALRSGESASRD